jgi:polysaccharide export outer membrane protein
LNSISSMHNTRSFISKAGSCSLLNLLVLVSVSLSFTSCFSSRPVPYFNGGLDTAQRQDVRIPDQLIQKGDILNIVIYSDNAEATAIYNQASGSGGSVFSPQGTKGNATATPVGTSGYLVDNNGSIRLHAIGTLYVEGMTRQQLEELITKKLDLLGVLSNPYCVIRFNNFKIIVLGEVASPGVFTIPTEKASVLEALGMAGDINMYGRKDKVMLIRENQGKRTYYNLNLTDPNIFSSPNFYLRQNDVLIVQADPRKSTAADVQTMQYITLGLTVVSTIAIIISLFQ